MDADLRRIVDELLGDPGRALDVEANDAARLLAQVTDRQARLSHLHDLLLVSVAIGRREKTGTDRLLTMEAVAERLQVPVAHAREMGRRHEIPTVRVGRYVRVRESSLRAWLQQREEALDAAPSRAYHPRPKKAERTTARVVPLRQSEGSR
jgi:excisionase family DNA binding protein